MIPFTLSEIALVLNAEWVGRDLVIDTVTIHSNNIVSKKCLFIALLGRRFDGHCFVEQAVFMGACALLVDRYFRLDIPQLIVKNTYIALVALSSWVRRQSSSKVIAITGSSGKTSVKEMTVSILSNVGKVVATQGNFNNEIGVPITLLRLTPQDDFAVIELGANNFGEIFRMSSLVSPDIVLVNNIFPAHLLGFGSLVGVAEGKGEIFSNLSIKGVCILNFDNNAWSLWKKSLFFQSVVTFSIYKKDGIDFFSSNVVFYRDNICFVLNTPYGSSLVRLSMLGIHNVSNALAASALACVAGAKLNEIVSGLEKVRMLSGRLFPIVLSPKKLLLDDSYNSNFGSILASIRVLQRVESYRVIVLGDIKELGTGIEVQYHRKIGELLSMTNVNKVLTIGNLSYFITHFSGRGEHYYSKDMLIIRLVQLFKFHERITILIKGSRSIFLDKLVMEFRECINDFFVE